MFKNHRHAKNVYSEASNTNMVTASVAMRNGGVYSQQFGVVVTALDPKTEASGVQY